MKNLIIGFSTNQNEADLQIFCKTLREIYSPEECDLVIATNRYHPYFDALSDIGVDFFSTVSEFVSRSNFFMNAIKKGVLDSYRVGQRLGLSQKLPLEAQGAYRTLLEAWHHPHFTRWLAYERFMTLNRRYDQVLIADVRDVAFQGPFFDTRRRKVALFPELEPYGPEAVMNTTWYRDAWGEKDLQRALGKFPVCIGTILGPFDDTLSMVREISEFFCLHPFNRVEQAVFNKMLIDDLIRTPYEMVENIAGPIATLSSDGAKLRTVLERGRICRATDHSVIPVIHMYDRFPDTKDLYAAALN